MSVAWPSGLERTCPKCGTPQESPGSTVCEHCGSDLSPVRAAKPSSPRRVIPLKQLLHLLPLKQLVRMPALLLRQGFVTVLALGSLILRGIRLALVLGSLAVGLSFVPQVSARVPVMKDVAATTRALIQQVPWIQQAQVWGSRLLANLKVETPPQRRASSQAVPSQKPVASKPVVGQPLTVKSTPSGATVRLNARSMGKTPTTLKVAPGTYKVTISRPGFVTVTRTITVKPGKTAAVTVALVAVSKASPAPVQAPPAPQLPPDTQREQP